MAKSELSNTADATSLKRKQDDTSGEAPHPRKKQKRTPPDFSNPSNTVTFIIGSKAEPFTVHKEFACFHSPVWSAALNGPCLEGETQSYKIDDCEPDLFRVLVNWMYTRELNHLRRVTQYQRTHRFEPADNTTGHTDDFTVHAKPDLDAMVVSKDVYCTDLAMIECTTEMELAQLWVLAFVDQYLVHTNVVYYIFANTTSSSSLRHYLIDEYAFYDKWDIDKDQLSGNPSLSGMTAEIAGVLSKAAHEGILDASSASEDLTAHSPTKFQGTLTRRKYIVPEVDEES